ncbi:unnamed protein product [Aureobasidium vineae]|uniref:Jacalin-type lectin domain-containing protein n=1 Tax=Aureobasidium vineae TaxID=2773715 RepID=A0A9N8P513_9PEZI|nr:unnamed protein product [Aureobasidium vineae]
MRISTIRQRRAHSAVRRRTIKQVAAAIPTRSIEAPSFTPHFSEEPGCDSIVVGCKSGIAQIEITNGGTTETISYDCSLSGQRTQSVTFDLKDFDQSTPLRLDVLGCNGRVKRTSDAWKTTIQDIIRINNSNVVLRKQSAIGIDVRTSDGDEETGDIPDGHKWAVLLQEKGNNGKLTRAKTIDLRIGAILDGAVVYYEDGHTTPCGLRYGHSGANHYFGGGNSQKLHIPPGVDIVKVEVNRFGWGNQVLGGIVMTLSDGTKAGCLNGHWLATSMFKNNDFKVMEAGVGEKIVGFFGTSVHYTNEFGIITGPADVELPPQAYDMAELQNIQARDWASNK